MFERQDHSCSDKADRLLKSGLLCSVLQAEKFNAQFPDQCDPLMGSIRPLKALIFRTKCTLPPKSAITATDGDNTHPEPK